MNDLTVQPAPQSRRELIVVEDSQSLFDSAKFDQFQRVGRALMYSTMLPEYMMGPKEFDYDQRALIACSNIVLMCDIADRWKVPVLTVIHSSGMVHGKPVFEGKLIAAVIEQRLGVRLDYEWTTEDDDEAEKQGDSFGIKVSGQRDTDSAPKSIRGTVGRWKTHEKGGALKGCWKPGASRMQLAYRGAREWCRLWAPWIILGVLGDDEINEIEERRPAQAQILNANPASNYTRPPAATPQETKDDVTIDATAAKAESDSASSFIRNGGGANAVSGSATDDKPQGSKAAPAKGNGGSPRGERAKPQSPEIHPEVGSGPDNVGEAGASGSPDTSGDSGRATGEVDDGRGAGELNDSVAKDPIFAESSEDQSEDEAATEGAQVVSSFYRMGQIAAEDGITEEPDGLSEEESLEWSMGYNEVMSIKAQKDRDLVEAETHAGDDIEEDEGGEADDDADMHNKYDLGYAQGERGEPMVTPRGLLGTQIDAWSKGYHAAIADKRAAEVAGEPQDAFQTCERDFVSAIDWGGVKGALLALSKTDVYTADVNEGGKRIAAVRKLAWTRVEALQHEGAESIRPIDDLTAYRCWMEWCDDPITIEETFIELADTALYKSINDRQRATLQSHSMARIQYLTELGGV